MRHDYGCPVLHQPVERLLHQALRLVVERTGRFVQQQDRRVFEDGAGDSDPLALTAAQVHAALADDALVLVREAHNEVVGISGAGGGDHLVFAGVQPPVEDVLADRAAEQDRLLRHDADLLAQAVLSHAA